MHYVALLAHLGCSAMAPDIARGVGGDEIHFQSGVQVIGPAAEPREVMRTWSAASPTTARYANGCGGS